MNVEALDGLELKAALDSYVRRSLTTGDDALLVGNSKDLLEAVAKYVLDVATGSYPQSTNFDATLFQAFDRLGMATPSVEILRSLDRDPEKAFEQVLWLLGVVGKRLRNEVGTGHGRPLRAHFPSAGWSELIPSGGTCRSSSARPSLRSKHRLDQQSQIGGCRPPVSPAGLGHPRLQPTERQSSQWRRRDVNSPDRGSRVEMSVVMSAWYSTGDGSDELI